MATAITILTPVPHQTFQADELDQANIAITGTYVDADPSAVEARWDGGSWITIDSSPAGGAFSGMMPSQALGQGLLEVRDAGNIGVTDSVAFITIGDVIVIAGQSNAQGKLTDAIAYSSTDGFKANMYRQDGAWAELIEPTDSDAPAGAYSLWTRLATWWMNTHHRPVAFITTAKGDTRLVGGTWTKPGAEYTNMVNMVVASLVNAVRLVIWWQGETDANVGAATSTYLLRLEQFILNYQTDVPAMEFTPLLCIQIGYKDTGGVTREMVDDIRTAHRLAPDTITDVLWGPCMFDIDISASSGGDGVHIQTIAHGDLAAARIARAVDWHLFDGTDGRGPIFDQARVILSGTRIEISFTVSSSPLVNPDEIGWRITDSAGLRTVISCTAGSANTLLLELDQPVIRPALISFGSFNDGANSVIRDSGSEPYPLTPFIDQPILGAAGDGSGWYGGYR